MMKIRRLLTYSAFIAIWVFSMLCVSCNGIRSNEAKVSLIDSVNNAAYECRFMSVDSSLALADRAYSLSHEIDYKDGMDLATINRAFVMCMKMDYDSSYVLYDKVHRTSPNELNRLKARIGLMRICQMTSSNKEFHSFKNKAQKSMDLLNSETLRMSDFQQTQWNHARAEFHFVSAQYFLTMRNFAAAKEDLAWIEANKDILNKDTCLLANYLSFNSSLMDADPSIKERNLIRLLQITMKSGNTFYESSALRKLVNFYSQKNSIKNYSGVLQGVLGVEDLSEDSLEFFMAKRSVELISKYGNLYFKSMSLNAYSALLREKGRYQEAIDSLSSSLNLINEYNRHFGVTDEMLFAYGTSSDSSSTEMNLITNERSVSLPEWMASIREQLSITYGAYGMKDESDFNRNIYLDIIDVTRHDKRMEERYEDLADESKELTINLFALLAIFVLSVGGGTYLLKSYSKRAQRKSGILSKMINSTKDIFRKDESEMEETKSAVMAEASQFKKTMSELTRVYGVLGEWVKQRIEKTDSFDEQIENLESERYVLLRHIDDYKRQYIDKTTSVAIANGITPFLDRAIREIDKLSSNPEASDEEVAERLKYVSELIHKINAFNDILGHWVKIRQGSLSLSVQNFELSQLFEIEEKSRKVFENKNLLLDIQPTTAVVKADKSLTLFMMNTLLDNARKYTPEGGRVCLKADATDKYVEISIADTGHGLTPEEVDMLCNSKVYDAKIIGSTSDANADIKANKGFGFGLMNCRGIIEKYRKTNKVFDVCCFSVESKQGEGSRFFFRLPVGTIRNMVVALAMVMAGMFVNPVVAEAQHSKQDSLGMSLLESRYIIDAQMYMDSVYMMNVRRDFEGAVEYADSAIFSINNYLKTAGRPKDVPQDSLVELSLRPGKTSEISLFESGIELCYDDILELRNEVAIAALSLGDGSLYHYNNELYTRLYNLIHEDTSYADECLHLERSNSNKKIVIVILIIFLIISTIVTLLIHYRRHHLNVFNLRQTIDYLSRLFDTTRPISVENLAEELFNAVNDVRAADYLAVMIGSEADKSVHKTLEYGRDNANALFLNQLMQAHMQEGVQHSVYEDGYFFCPLAMDDADGGADAYGMVGVIFHDKSQINRADMVHISDILHFTSVYLYSISANVEQQEEQIELLSDDRNRIERTENRIHIQNMVLDNCLSAIKHETMYYPNRIAHLLETVKEDDREECFVHIDEVSQLINYYKEVFTLLLDCATRQLEKIVFKRVSMDVNDIVKYVASCFAKSCRKTGMSNELVVDRTVRGNVLCDKIMLQYFIENIISLSFEQKNEGELHLDFEDTGKFLKFVFKFTNLHIPEDLLPEIFYADSIKYDEVQDVLIGSQFILCKQIIREHDEHCGIRGCRIYAEKNEMESINIVFTLPKK